MTQCPSITNKTNPTDFKSLLTHVRELILSARHLANRSIDTIQILTNFRIGQAIIEHEQHGKKVPPTTPFRCCLGCP